MPQDIFTKAAKAIMSRNTQNLTSYIAVFTFLEKVEPETFFEPLLVAIRALAQRDIEAAAKSALGAAFRLTELSPAHQHRVIDLWSECVTTLAEKDIKAGVQAAQRAFARAEVGGKLEATAIDLIHMHGLALLKKDPQAATQAALEAALSAGRNTRTEKNLVTLWTMCVTTLWETDIKAGVQAAHIAATRTCAFSLLENEAVVLWIMGAAALWEKDKAAADHLIYDAMLGTKQGRALEVAASRMHDEKYPLQAPIPPSRNAASRARDFVKRFGPQND